MDRRRIVGQLRVQEIFLSGGRRSWTILWPEGAVHEEADRFLRRYDGEPGTQRTYAYLLVDHLRWLERDALQLNAVRLRDLQRYMGLVGAAVRVPLGEPWRIGKQPYGTATLGTAASVLKGFYLGLAHEQVSVELRRDLDRTRLPSKADRNRSLLGHVSSTMPANPLAPRKGGRRHPKMLPDEGRGRLLRKASTTRDRMIVTWLYDGGIFSGCQPCGGGSFLSFAQLRG